MSSYCFHGLIIGQIETNFLMSELITTMSETQWPSG